MCSMQFYQPEQESKSNALTYLIKYIEIYMINNAGMQLSID